MKTSLAILLLSLTALDGNNGNGVIPVRGCYCEPDSGMFRSGSLMIVGDRYTLKNEQADFIYVIVMPGSVQNLGAIAPGETRTFTALGTSLLVAARGHEGEVVKIELRHVK